MGLQLFLPTLLLLSGCCFLSLEAKCMESQISDYKTIKTPINPQNTYRRVRQLFSNFNRWNNNEVQPKKFEQTVDGTVYHPNFNPDFVFPEDSFKPHRAKSGNLQSSNDWQGIVPNKGNRPNSTQRPRLATSRQEQRPNLCQLECHKTTTNEYNPICGSDNVTYSNPGKFRCATFCGKAISGRPNSTCRNSITI